MNILLTSDIHGNYMAFTAVLDKIRTKYNVDACVFLGDLIDYAPHSNKIIEILRKMQYPILCNIWGNHEKAIMCEDFRRFSTERGKACARYTKDTLSDNSFLYIRNYMCKQGKFEFECDGKKCLAIHGSLVDEFWSTIDINVDILEYRKYDYVFSGHSHIPHFFEKYYEVRNPDKRDRAKTIFINPGSVGQPRNLNNMAQFAVLNTEEESVYMEKVVYDIEKEQSCFSNQVDEFYKKRLYFGI